MNPGEHQLLPDDARAKQELDRRLLQPPEKPDTISWRVNKFAILPWGCENGGSLAGIAVFGNQ